MLQEKSNKKAHVFTWAGKLTIGKIIS